MTAALQRKFCLFGTAAAGGEAKFYWVVEFLKNRNELTTWADFTSRFRNELNTLKIPISNAPYSTVVDLRELPGGVRLIGVEPARLEAEPAIGGVIENVIGAAAATIGVTHLLAEAAHRLARRARLGRTLGRVRPCGCGRFTPIRTAHL